VGLRLLSGPSIGWRLLSLTIETSLERPVNGLGDDPRPDALQPAGVQGRLLLFAQSRSGS